MNRHLILSLALLSTVTALAKVETAKAPAETPAKLTLPAIRSLKLEPSSLTLLNGRDHRRILVIGEAANGQKYDLTAEATLKAESAIVEIDPTGSIAPKSAGTTKILVSAAGQSTKLSVKVDNADLPTVGFVRDVEPILAKVGCNQAPATARPKAKTVSNCPCAATTPNTITRL